MKYAICFLLSLTFLINVSGCRSRARLTSNLPQQSNAELMTVAKQKYQKGELDAAERDLLCVLKADTRNREAHYYLHLVQQSKTKQKLELERLIRERDGLWHPTLPPKEVL
jgi:hypothetical protein